MSPHGGARVVGDGVEVVNGVVCGAVGVLLSPAAPQSASTQPPTVPAAPAASIPCLPPLTPLSPTRWGQEEPRGHQGIRGMLALTAALRGEFPEVQVLQREVDEGGEFAASYPGLREALQVWRDTSRSQKDKGKPAITHLCPPQQPLSPSLCPKDTKHQDLGELLDAEFFCALCPGFAATTRLWGGKQYKQEGESTAHHPGNTSTEGKGPREPPLPHTGFSSPSSTSSLVKSRRQSMSVTSP